MTTERGRAWPSLALPAVLVGIALALVIAGTSRQVATAAAPHRQDDTTERDVDDRAVEVLQAMSDVLAEADSFSFRSVSSESIVDDVTGRVVHYLAGQTISVTRPDRLHSDANDPFSRHETWFANGTLTAFDSLAGHYTTIRTAASIDDMLDTLHEEHDLVIPLGDLVVSDPFPGLIAGVTTGDYLGESFVSGRTCHHLAMQQDDLDWQIWIAAEGPAVPLKLVITYTTDEGHPQFSASFEDWDLDASFAPGQFEPSIPDDAEAVDVAAFRGEGDAS